MPALPSSGPAGRLEAQGSAGTEMPGRGGGFASGTFQITWASLAITMEAISQSEHLHRGAHPLPVNALAGALPTHLGVPCHRPVLPEEGSQLGPLRKLPRVRFFLASISAGRRWVVPWDRRLATVSHH